MGRNFFKYYFLCFLWLGACSSRQTFDLPPTQDVFGQQIKYNNKLDLIVMIDNSSSMQQHQERLSSQVGNFVNAMAQLKMDFHLAVITSDMSKDGTGGSFVGEPRVLTSASPNVLSEVTLRVVQGETGSNLERGLDSLRAVLSPEYLSTEGKGFWRDDALLVVVALSDEDDKSAISSTQLTDYLNSIKAPAKDGSKNWLFNFIGVTQLTGTCTTFNDYAEPGLKFIDLVNASGGRVESICTANLATAVTNIKAKIVQILTDYHLDREPVLSSISVTINGQPVSEDEQNGWTYVAEGRLIRFHGTGVPPADASIVIDYKPLEAK